MRASDFISYVQTMLGDPEGQFHPSEKILLHLNTTIEDICTRSRTICTFNYIAAVKDQGVYGMPENYLEAKNVFFYYQGELIPLTRDTLTNTAPPIFSKYTYNNVPMTYSEGGNAYVEKLVSSVQTGKIRTDASSDVWRLTLDDYYPNILIGDRFINITDNSEGIISIVMDVNPTQLQIREIKNGVDNQIAVDDQFRILSRTEHRHSLNIAPAPGKTDKIGAESLYVFFARTHTPITIENLQNQNDYIELGAEWNRTIRNGTCYYASLVEKGVDSPTTDRFQIIYETEYKKAEPKAKRRTREALSHWKKTPRRPPPRVVISSLDESRDPTIAVE